MASRVGSSMHGEGVVAAELVLLGGAPVQFLSAALGGTMRRLNARVNFGLGRTRCTGARMGRGRGAFPDFGRRPRDAHATLTWRMSSGLTDRNTHLSRVGEGKGGPQLGVQSGTGTAGRQPGGRRWGGGGAAGGLAVNFCLGGGGAVSTVLGWRAPFPRNGDWASQSVLGLLRRPSLLCAMGAAAFSEAMASTAAKWRPTVDNGGTACGIT